MDNVCENLREQLTHEHEKIGVCVKSIFDGRIKIRFLDIVIHIAQELRRRHEPLGEIEFDGLAASVIDKLVIFVPQNSSQLLVYILFGRIDSALVAVAAA